MPALEAELPFVEVCYPSRRSVLSASSARGSKLILFVPTPHLVEAGTALRLLLSMRDSSRLFELCGTVLSDSAGARGPRMAGFNLAFLGDDKRRAAEMLAFCADRPPSMGTAACRRFDVSLPCRMRAGDQKSRAQLLDMSRTGAFLTVPDPQRLAAVTQLDLEIKPGVMGLFGRWVRGEVVWRGRKGGSYGVGIRFIGDRAEVGQVLDGLVTGRAAR